MKSKSNIFKLPCTLVFLGSLILIWCRTVAPAYADTLISTPILRLNGDADKTIVHVDMQGIPAMLENFVKTKSNLLECRIPDGGEKSILIRYTGQDAISIPICEIRLESIENCALQYGADLSSKEVLKSAYLEMWCIFSKERVYFSRGLNHALSDSMNWRTVQTPFYLKKGERPESVQLGIRMEGPGEVQIKNMYLEKQSGLLLRGRWEWIPGTLLGIFGGLYGSITGMLAPRGRGRVFVKSIGIVLLIFSTGFLITGMVFFSLGKPWEVWYPWLLPGVIGTTLFSVLPKNVMRQYENAELRRIQAKDTMETLS
jgi:hypothetical protein